MSRQPRLDAPGTLHHVMGRGIEGAKVFRGDEDREDFLTRLADLCQEGFFTVYAWVLMDNHFHVLIRTGHEPLARGMRRLLTGYVINFNLRHRRHGYLFQNWYKSIVCEDDPYLLELTRYIHLNPVRAGIVHGMRKLWKYPSSGHAVLMGVVQRGWQDTATVLAYFGRRKGIARLAYEGFVREGIARGRRPELVGGGLVRSLGGWTQVLALRTRGIKGSADDRILGSSEFVESLLSEADARERETLRLSANIRGIGSLIKEIADGERVLESELRSGSRQRRIARVRRLVCQLAVRTMNYPGAEVARALGVTTSAVVRAAHSAYLPEIQKYL
jgi:putative transposase